MLASLDQVVLRRLLEVYGPLLRPKGHFDAPRGLEQFEGKVRSVQELAALEKTSVETITRNLPLAVLKPGQVEKLLKGQHTPDLSVAQLLKAPSLL